MAECMVHREECICLNFLLLDWEGDCIRGSMLQQICACPLVVYVCMTRMLFTKAVACLARVSIGGVRELGAEPTLLLHFIECNMDCDGSA